MRRILAIVFLLPIVGCAGAETPAQRLFVAQSNLNAALGVAAAYVRQPECSPPLIQNCAEPDVKRRVKSLAADAGEALALARTGRGAITETAYDARIVAASTAVSALIGYLAAEGVIR